MHIDLAFEVLTLGDFVFGQNGKLTLRHLSSASDDRPSMEVVTSAFRRAASASVDAGDG